MEAVLKIVGHLRVYQKCKEGSWALMHKLQHVEKKGPVSGLGSWATLSSAEGSGREREKIG